MSSIGYKIRCLKSLDINTLFKVVDNISEKTKLNKNFLLMDMLYCSNKYGAGYHDYQEFEFYNLKKKQRSTYLTRVKNNALVKKYNNKTQMELFDNKKEFNKIFNKYLKRDWLFLEDNYEEFINFCNNKKEFIAKPVDGCGGKGVELIKVDKRKLKTIYERLIKENKLIIEEKIIQNKEISKLNKTSVNSLRIVTYYDGKKVHILNTVFKIGNGGITDNFSSGSMYTFVENGKIIVPAIDVEDKIYKIHPISKIDLVGYEIPNYKEAIKLVSDCAKKISEVKYVGWDVAILDKGACIIEGNCYPGIYQIKPSFLEKKEGLVKTYEHAMKIKIDKI